MPNLTFITATALKITRTDRAKVVSIPAGAAGNQIRDRISENIHKHVAALQSKGITDLSTLGKLPIAGNVVPSPGVLKPPSLTTRLRDIIARDVTFKGAFRIKGGSTGATVPLVKVGGTAYILKAEPVVARPITTTPSRVAGPLISTPPRRIPTQPFFAPELPISIAYWAANEIEIADDTQITLKQPHHWLVMIANKITIGNNVVFNWEQEDKGIPRQTPALSKLPPPPTSIYMNGTDGRDGADGDPDNAGRGLDGDRGPEIEIWTLDINRLPSEVLLAGQNGFKGGRGQNGQDGQDGAKGRAWREGALGSCSSGPGNGGDGGDGGDGGKGGRGGNGGHGGRFNLFAPNNILTNVSAQGYYIDTKEGLKGPGGEAGEGGEGGAGGRKGKDRSGILGGCPTSFGKNGSKGNKGGKGAQGVSGNDGDHYTDAEKLYPINNNTFIEAFNKPAIIDLSDDSARVGDTLSAIGKNFANTDKVYVDDVVAPTTYVSDTLITFVVPSVEGGRQKPVYVKQHDGTMSNQETLHVLPEIFWIEQDGKKSTDIPAPRFTPGKKANIIGTGFSAGLTIKMNNYYAPDNDITYTDPTRVSFTVFRPGGITPNPSGEDVTIEVILEDGPQSGQVHILLDTFVIVVLGDSIEWGQGLRNDLKFHTLVENHINGGEIGVYKTVHAHSGATIGVGVSHQESPVDGEVPTGYPTILQQVDLYSDDPTLVDLVLIDGGINDIGVEEIVSPIATSNLANLAHAHCYEDVKILLNKVARHFPNAKIIITGYYQIVSRDSDLTALILLLTGLGMLVGGLAGAIVGGVVSAAQKDVMVSRSKTFANEANQKLQQAVNDINTALGGSPRVFFAKPDYKNSNAIFAPNSWLWGIETDLGPADDEEIGGVEQARSNACHLVESQDPDRTEMTKCIRASIGHPNVKGAQEYARVINALV